MPPFYLHHPAEATTGGERLPQLDVVHADEETRQAVEDWHYWVDMGYGF
jgi:hypothetical protein